MNQQELVDQLLFITEELDKQLSSIHSNMKLNSPEQVEMVQHLVEKRQTIIDQLEELKKQVDFQWTSADQKIFMRIQEYEQTIRPRLNKLYQSFTNQINRMNQTKQVSKKYIGAYQNMITDGSFIDKRK